jgi:hypothetical protein
MDYSTVPVKIISAPTDWPTVFTAFAAAFLGAATAFLLNIFLDRLRERQKRLDTINIAVYGLLMSITTLVNLKEQFLTKFQTEFEELQKFIRSTNLLDPEGEVATSVAAVNTHINNIGAQDPQLNGALIPWQEIDFPLMPNPTLFNFTVSGNPNIIRLVHVAKIEMEGVAKLICTRNAYWQKKR